MLIRKANGLDRHRVVEILNEATLDLHEKGVRQWSYPWKEEDISEDIENQYCYVLLIHKNIIGTFFISEINRLSGVDVPKGSFYLSKITLIPDYQGKQLGKEIVRFACNYTSVNKKELFLDCWAGNETLKAFYSNSGFKQLGDFPEKDYMISVFHFK